MTWVTRTTACLAGATLVVDLLGPVLGSPEAPHDSAERADYGSTTAPNGRLHRGCHDYPYRYRLTLPSDDWTLEVFLRDPSGQGLASGAFTSDSDPTAQRSRFRFCRYSTRAGRFTIGAKAHWYDGSGVGHRVWLEPSSFRLRRPR